MSKERPMYETDQDLANEAAFAERIEKFTRAKLYKMPIKYRLDYAAVRENKVVAWLELRERKTPKDRYPDYQTGAEKIWQGISLAELYDIPFFLFVRFTDGDYWMEMTRSYATERPLEMMHLTSRDDPQDIEPCMSIELNELKGF